ncbi:MAG TPA: right-handed parallel beta-helix repeat-containing protein [Solirubrobacterales bacterium]|nr:right-handed parallel beta-helix repeat-containing protein [Solirubrobacterales bacterium]
MASATRMVLAALLACLLTAVPAEAGHVACGDRITQDTRLDSDLLECPGVGLVIAGNDVTVDFAGHALDGIGSETEEAIGITMEPHVDRFTLVRGTISEFFCAVMTQEPGLLDRMRIVDNPYCGIESRANVEVRNSFFAGNGAASDGPNRVTGSTFIDNTDHGIRTRGTGFIVGNVVRRNPTGIILEEGTGMIARNFVTDNPGAGIDWNFSAAGTVRDNFVARNGYGITLHQEEYRANPLIERNVVLGNRVNGIHGHWAGRGSLVTRNLVYGNGGSGIHATGFGPCPEVRDNYVAHNGLNGIAMVEAFTPFSGSQGVTPECSGSVSGNIARHNAADGIDVADMTVLVAVGRNRADRNGELGIEARDVIDGGGNRARRNRDPRQCVGVTCR